MRNFLAKTPVCSFDLTISNLCSFADDRQNIGSRSSR